MRWGANLEKQYDYMDNNVPQKDKPWIILGEKKFVRFPFKVDIVIQFFGTVAPLVLAFIVKENPKNFLGYVYK